MDIYICWREKASPIFYKCPCTQLDIIIKLERDWKNMCYTNMLRTNNRQKKSPGTNCVQVLAVVCSWITHTHTQSWGGWGVGGGVGMRLSVCTHNSNNNNNNNNTETFWLSMCVCVFFLLWFFFGFLIPALAEI